MYRMSRIGLALLVAAVGCGGDATGPQAQFVLTAVSSEASEGVVGSLALAEPTVRLTDRGGKPVANAEVRFDVYVETGGAVGSVARRIDTTDAKGIASAGEWTLSTIAGMNVLRVTAYGALTLIFRADAKPDVPALLGWEAELENQVALPGMTLQPPTLHVRDRFGNSIGGVAVMFAVTAGGGALEASEAVTTGAGASAIAWTLGTSLEANTIRASALDLESIEFTIHVVEAVAIYDLMRIDGEPLDGSQVASAFIALTADGHFVSHRATNYGDHQVWTESGTYEISGSTIRFDYGGGYLEEGTLVNGMLLIERWSYDDFPQEWQYEMRG